MSSLIAVLLIGGCGPKWVIPCEQRPEITIPAPEPIDAGPESIQDAADEKVCNCPQGGICHSYVCQFDYTCLRIAANEEGLCGPTPYDYCQNGVCASKEPR